MEIVIFDDIGRVEEPFPYIKGVSRFKSNHKSIFVTRDFCFVRLPVCLSWQLHDHVHTKH